MAISYGNQTLGRGEVRFSRLKSGTYIPDGFRYVGNSTSFAITNAVTNLDHYSSDHGIREKDKSVPVEVNRSGKFDLDDIQLDNLALFFFGTSATVSQTSLVGSGTTETLTAVTPGLSYQLGISSTRPAGVKGIANLVVKVLTATKVAGTDYVVDTARGIVTVLAGGGIASGDTLLLTYDLVATSYDQVISGHVPVTGAIQYIADNPEGANIDYMMRYVRLIPNGDFALKSDNAWQQLPFTVEILRAPGLESIYANGQPYTA